QPFLLGIAIFCIIDGLFLSIWAIVYMRRVGDGNPMDAFGHEVAPRTKHLMTDGPYRLSRNPMLTGIFVYLIGCCICLWTWQSLVVFLVFVAIMLVQVRTEEERLRRDFGEEYEEYCKKVGRFFPKIGKIS
ncbi:MAG: isoprenylcysteine carboxylmethyltransferase family protein, partial [Bacteroidales bacterium]|nr:isoprenylcysteine carboxylmethyltransferase family protein [Bacteroidales bacterium]